MQDFRKMKNIIIKLVVPIILFASICGCERDFETLNKNPFKPIQTEIGPLFNGVVQSLTLGWSEQLYLHNESLYKLTQLAALSATTFDNPSIGKEEVWSRYYSSLTNIRDIESRINDFEGDLEAMNNVKAMVKTLLAYKTFRLTDLFGDIPFFEAGKGFEGVEFIRPGFDAQEDIYKFLLDELKWVNDFVDPLAVETSMGSDYISLNGFDVLFDEDMIRWVKFANSLRLRHALRMYDADPTFAEMHIKDIMENNLPLIDKNEDVLITPRLLQWDNKSVHWSFREHRKLRMGSNIWRKFSENDEIDGSGIYDPRARIFFETNNDGEWKAFPQLPDENTEPSGGGPYQSARDVNYNLKGNDNIYSAFNYYLIRDELDVPEIIMTSAEVNFILAELFLRGLGVEQDESQARAAYDAGISHSIQFWHKIVDQTQIWVNAPPPLGVNGEFITINHDQVRFSNSDNPIELIYTQRWIDSFRQPWEAYALGRRTQLTPVEGDRIEHNRFTYPDSEAENNPENWAEQVAKMGGDTEKTRLWWMN